MEIAIGILGLIIAWLTFKKTFYAEPKEEKEHLLVYFLATQQLSKEVSDILTEYATSRNAFDTELYKGITYRSYIAALINSQNTNLSDETFHKVKLLRLTKSNIASMQKSLELQNEDLQKMKNYFMLANNKFG